MGRAKRIRKAKMAKRRIRKFRNAICKLNTYIRKMNGTFGSTYTEFRDKIRELIRR